MLDTAIRGLEEIGRSTAGAPPDLSQAVAYQKLGDIFRVIGRSDDRPPALRPVATAGRGAISSQSPGEIEAAEVLYRAHMGLGLLDLRAEQFDAAKRTSAVP